MYKAPSATRLAEALPGSWSVRATNLVQWLDGQRNNPTFTFESISNAPLMFSDRISFTTKEGVDKSIAGRARLKRGVFVWRGSGMLKPISSVWLVAGLNSEGTIAVIKYRKTLSRAAGLDVIVRDDANLDEVRTSVAQQSDFYGLSLEDFASLNWL